MHEDNRDVVIGIGGLVLSLSLIIGSLFGSYKLGRYYERKDLTQYFAQMTVDTYQDGYQDGFKMGDSLRDKACAAEKQALAKHFNALEDSEDGRY